MELTWLQASSCHFSDPRAAGGVRHPWDTGGPLLWQPFAQEMGGGKPVPWDGSCSHGRGLHRACANHIFSQIKCSSLVKFEHIPGTQDEAQPLFPPYLPNCFKGRILKQNKDKCFIFPYPHSWKELCAPAEIFPQNLTGGCNPPCKKSPPSLGWFGKAGSNCKAGFHRMKDQASLKVGGTSGSPPRAHGVRLQHAQSTVTLFIGRRGCASVFQGLFPLFFPSLRKPAR